MEWGCVDNKRYSHISSSPEPQYLKDLTESAHHYADSVLTTLTLEERAGQCLMPSIQSKNDSIVLNELTRFIEDYHVGGVVLMEGDLESAHILSQIGKESKIPLFVAIDAEWGLGMRLADAPVYPKNGRIARDSEETGLFDYGRQIAEESRAVGINMILGPVIDISIEGDKTIGKRSFGYDPGLVSNYGVAYAKGVESGGVVTVAKHFPGHGRALNNSHVEIAQLKGGISALDTMELRPFREYINSGLSGIMAGHIQAHALDPAGKAASVSIDMLTSLLREEMGFKGLILTDAFNMGGARGLTATEALNAGADIILCPSNLYWEHQNIMKDIKEGRLKIEILDARCKRILFTKYIFGIV